MADPNTPSDPEGLEVTRPWTLLHNEKTSPIQAPPPIMEAVPAPYDEGPSTPPSKETEAPPPRRPLPY